MMLQGKSAVITGGARGIGYGTAERFLREGADVFICDIHEDNLEQALRELARLGRVEGKITDISKKDDVSAAVREAQCTFGKIDILVNNAGIGKSTPFLELTDEIWDQVMNVNLKGSYYFSQEVLKMMTVHRSGVIINISSTNGMRGQPKMAHYNASKAGLISLTQTLALEFADYGIRCNCVCPGSIATALSMQESGWDPDFLEQFRRHIPMQRFGSPDDIAWACAFVASDAAQFMTGQTLVFDGGLLAKQ